MNLCQGCCKGQQNARFCSLQHRTSSKPTKTLGYQTIVRPRLEYSSSIWSPHLNFLREDLEKVQKRAVRYVSAVYIQKAPVTDMQKTFEWDTLEIRQCKSVATMGYKIVNSLVAYPPSSSFLPKTVLEVMAWHSYKFHLLPIIRSTAFSQQ